MAPWFAALAGQLKIATGSHQPTDVDESVVAEEVRNLAMRAAEAAKNTANLIEGTVKKVKSGSEIVLKTNETFEKVSAGAKKVAGLVGEISAASYDQAQGSNKLIRR